MRLWLKSMIVAALLFFGSSVVQAWAPGQMVVPEDIYYWMQSTDRMNYYINRQRITYGIKSDGKIDFYTLVVPVVKSYDGVQVKDVIEKRKWRELPMDGFEYLNGEANYYEIDLKARIATLKKLEYLTYSMTVIDAQNPEQKTEIDKLSEKHVERRFFESIFAYEKDHFEDIIKNTKEKLSEKEFSQLVKEHKKVQKALAKKK